MCEYGNVLLIASYFNDSSRLHICDTDSGICLQGCAKRVISFEMSLDKFGADLKQCVSVETGLEKMRLKLISAGKVIHDGQTLHSQNIKVNTCIFICTSFFSITLSWQKVSYNRPRLLYF